MTENNKFAAKLWRDILGGIWQPWEVQTRMNTEGRDRKEENQICESDLWCPPSRLGLTTTTDV